jgi:hypothetical protein
MLYETLDLSDVEYDEWQKLIGWRDGMLVSIDWKEAPVAFYRLMTLIAEQARPTVMPAAPAIAFGDHAGEVIEAYLESIDTDCYDSNYKVVNIIGGDDSCYFALVAIQSDA